MTRIRLPYENLHPDRYFSRLFRRYGGHIVNDFDRLLATEYLDWFMKDELLDETELYPFAEDEKGVSFLVSYYTSGIHYHLV